MDEAKIVELTKQAEAGNGCGIREALQGLTFDDTVIAIKEIERQNRTNRETNQNLPELSMTAHMDPDLTANIYLNHPGEHWYSSRTTLIQAGIALNNNATLAAGDRTLKCENRNKK